MQDAAPEAPPEGPPRRAGLPLTDHERAVLATPPPDEAVDHAGHVLAGWALTAALSRREWDRAELVWEAVLARDERTQMLGRVIRSSDADDALELMTGALEALHAPPEPPLGALDDEARWWVGGASEAFRKHMLIACFRSLPPADRVAFLKAAQGMVLA